MHPALSSLRRRFHPLWRLRQFRAYRAFQRVCDFPVSVRIKGLACRVMFLRDFSLVAGGRDEIGAVLDAEGARRVAAFAPTHVFDVGANIGLFSWHMHAWFPSAQLFLFEPDRTNQRLLSATIRRNRLAAVLYAGAVSDRAGDAAFVVDRASGTTGSLIRNANSLHHSYGLGAETTRIPTFTLDDCSAGVTGSSPRVLLKIDVEGAEGLVLAGAAGFLRRFRPLIIVECFDPAEIAPVLAGGYRCTPMEEGNYLLEPDRVDS